VTHNGLGLADVPALAFRLIGKLIDVDKEQKLNDCWSAGILANPCCTFVLLVIGV